MDAPQPPTVRVGQSAKVKRYIWGRHYGVPAGATVLVVARGLDRFEIEYDTCRFWVEAADLEPLENAE